MQETFITEEDIRSAADTALGSRMFTRKAVIGGAPTQILHVSVKMCMQEFEQEYQRLQDAYNALNSHMGRWFFHYAGDSALDYDAIYSFYAAEGWQPLRGLMTQLTPADAADVLRQLLEMLQEYRHSAINGNGYRPLLFLCADSVYLRRKNGAPEICLLPMPYAADTRYAGMPHEAPEGHGDPSSDVAMAAYLYLQMRCANGDPFAGEDPVVQLAERCLSPFLSRRPSAEALLTVLEAPHGAAAGPSDPEDNGWVVVTDGEEEELLPPRPQPQARPFAWVEKWRRKTNRKVKKVTGTLTDVRDQFDRALSTEEGDAQETED